MNVSRGSGPSSSSATPNSGDRLDKHQPKIAPSPPTRRRLQDLAVSPIAERHGAERITGGIITCYKSVWFLCGGGQYIPGIISAFINERRVDSGKRNAQRDQHHGLTKGVLAAPADASPSKYPHHTSSQPTWYPGMTIMAVNIEPEVERIRGGLSCSCSCRNGKFTPALEKDVDGPGIPIDTRRPGRVVEGETPTSPRFSMWSRSPTSPRKFSFQATESSAPTEPSSSVPRAAPIQTEQILEPEMTGDLDEQEQLERPLSPSLENIAAEMRESSEPSQTRAPTEVSHPA